MCRNWKKNNPKFLEFTILIHPELWSHFLKCQECKFDLKNVKKELSQSDSKVRVNLYKSYFSFSSYNWKHFSQHILPTHSLGQGSSSQVFIKLIFASQRVAFEPSASKPKTQLSSISVLSRQKVLSRHQILELKRLSYNLAIKLSQPSNSSCNSAQLA